TAPHDTATGRCAAADTALRPHDEDGDTPEDAQKSRRVAGGAVQTAPRTPSDTAWEPVPHTMLAWTQTRYGGPEVVQKDTIEVPAPGRGEVLLRMRATALNAGDVRVMRGEPLLVRAFFGLRRPRGAVRGMDVAGTVVALGPEVTEFALG